MLQIAVYPYLICSLLWGLGRLQPAMARRLLSASWGVYALMWALTFGAIWLISRAIPPPPLPSVLTPQTAAQPLGVLDLLIPANPSYSPHSRDSLTGMVQTSEIA
jgi:proton glutamate symport protein